MGWHIKIERKAQKALKKVPDPSKTNIIEEIDMILLKNHDLITVPD